MKVKTAEATEKQLDWGLAVAMGCTSIRQQHTQTLDGSVKIDARDPDGFFIRVDHADPRMCMGLVENWKINVKHILYSTPDRAVLACWGNILDGSGYAQALGSTVVEAVARCVIAMRLEDEFECPDELGVMG